MFLCHKVRVFSFERLVDFPILHRCYTDSCYFSSFHPSKNSQIRWLDGVLKIVTHTYNFDIHAYIMKQTHTHTVTIIHTLSNKHTHTSTGHLGDFCNMQNAMECIRKGEVRGRQWGEKRVWAVHSICQIYGLSLEIFGPLFCMCGHKLVGYDLWVGQDVCQIFALYIGKGSIGVFGMYLSRQRQKIEQQENENEDIQHDQCVRAIQIFHFCIWGKI